MHLKILIEKDVDGYSAVIPSVKGCETWSKDSDEALDKVIHLLSFYLKLENNFKYKLDQTLNHPKRKIYNIIFDKPL